MADLSTYKGLELPKSNERYNIEVVNKNNRIIDSELHKLDLKNESQDELLAAKEAQLSANLSGHISDTANPHGVTKAQLNLNNVENTSDMDKPVSTAQQEALDAYYRQSTGYTDQKIADLIGGAPSTLDTLGEIADAMSDNQDVVAALNTAIGSKANQAEVKSLLDTKLDMTGDLQDTTITFTGSDTASPSEWENFDLLTSGESAKSLFAKISALAKNLRFLHTSLGGFTFYPEALTQAQYDALPSDAKSTPKMIFMIKNDQ